MKEQAENFSKFGTHFQTKVIQSLLIDSKFFDRIFDILELNYFDSKSHYWLHEKIQKYFNEYKIPPTLDNLEVYVLSEKDELMKQQVHEIIRTIKKAATTDIAFIKDEAIKFCRHMRMKKALYKSIEMWEKEKYDEIYRELNEALKAGQEANIGHEYWGEHALEQRIALMKRSPVPTGLTHLDEILNGGLSKGELGVFVAPTGLGKSWLLCVSGKTAVEQKLRVVHYTYELYEHQVGLRYDTMFTGIPQEKIPFHIAQVKKLLAEKKVADNLIIKHYPTKKFSLNAVRMHVDKISQQGFVPDMLIIDYADLVKPSQKYDQKRFELEGIYEELRGMAGELAVPIWTASQSNRGSLESEVVGLDAIAESFAKAAVADVVITLSRTIEDKLNNSGRLFVAKNRAGRDGLVIPLTMDLKDFKIATRPAFETVDDLRIEIQKLSKITGEKPVNTTGDSYKEHNKKKYAQFKAEQGNGNGKNGSDLGRRVEPQTTGGGSAEGLRFDGKPTTGSS